MEKGIEPKVREKLISRAFQVMNRSKAGITVTQEDIDWQTMKVVEMIQSEMNRMQMKKMREMEHKTNKGR